MIPRLRPHLSPADIFAAARGASSIEQFEAAFAARAEQRSAVAFPYGRSGLLLLLEALGLKDREIICPAYTCVVVAHAIVLSGNRPVFVDSEAGGFNMDLDRAEAAITLRTGALIATSVHGYPVDLDRLAELSQRHPELLVIQDCAHSFFAKHHGRPVQKAGVAALYGLNISKLITSIFGGVVTTDDEALATQLRLLRDARLARAGALRHFQHAMYLAAAMLALTPTLFSVVDRIRRLGFIDRFTEYYDPEQIDMPADHLVAMCRADASVGLRQTHSYRAIVDHRRRLVEVYDQALSGCRGLRKPPLVAGATYSHYVPRVADAQAVCATMARQGVELGRVIDYCIPDMPAYRPFVPTDSTFEVTRQLNREVVNLPLHVSADAARDISAKLTHSLEMIRSAS